MILLGIVAGLVLGVLARGRLSGLLTIRLRWVGLIFWALVFRVGTQVAIASGNELVAEWRLPLYAAGFGILAVACWLNRSQPGMLAIAVGVATNGIAVVVNGGWMPVWPPALAVAGMGLTDLDRSFHLPLPSDLTAEFFLRAGPLGDILPLPLGPLANVASVGDVFIGAGLAWFLFSALVRRGEAGEGGVSFGPLTATAPTPAREAAVPDDTWLGFERPVVLGGGRGPGLTQPQPLGARIRGHPYTRLATDPRFAAFWLAQAISLFGDRLHQVALAVLVLALTDSPLATGLVFMAATLPNLVLSPFAGVLVDRWDHRKVMIASDLVRALLVAALPLAAFNAFVLVYPLVFAITTVSLFFRPAKTAVIPRIVRPDDVLAANSVVWTADTLADIAGYPLAGLFVYFLGASIGLAFFVDAATYVLSALLLAAITIPPVLRAAVPAMGGALRSFMAELMEGWRFLRGQPTLIQNTLVSTLAQASIGVTLALTVVYARDALDQSIIPYPTNFAAIDTAIGVGNLLGGLAVGLIGSRLRKGWLVVIGFVVMGLSTVLLGLTDNVLLALTAATVIGVANLVYVIPTQTIFLELTPAELMGRVVSFRSALVFGSMMGAMGVSGLLAEYVPVGLVIAGFGALTALAGMIGALLPAVRDPR